MCTLRRLFIAPLAACLFVARPAAAADPGPAAEQGTARDDAPSRSRGDLFPRPLRPSVAAGTGLPFLGIVEAGMGVTNGFALGVVGGITPSVVTAGLRPRARVATSERTAIVFVMPALYYPKASAPGPGNVGTSSWLLAKPEVLFDGALGERWHLAGGMGIVAAGSIEALGQFFAGREFRMPPYGDGEARRGFAGGLWNTIASRASYAFDRDTHLFAEGTLVMKGFVPADNVGGPPIVVTVGAQHTF